MHLRAINLLKQRSGFTLVEIMIVVLIIGILLAIAVPNFLSARENSRAKACIENLREIDTAKDQWMIDQKSSTFSNFVIGPGSTSSGVLNVYLRNTPQCPENGYYTSGNEAQLPVCTTTSGGSVITGTTTSSFYAPHQMS